MSLEKLKKDVARLRAVASQIKRSGISLTKANKIRMLTDYKEKKKEYLLNQLKSALNSIKHNKKALEELASSSSKIAAVQVPKLIAKLDYDNLEDVAGKIDSFLSGVKVVRETEYAIHAQVPLEIRDDINYDIEEINKCLKSGCYRSVVILCGRVLETILHRKYYDTTGIDLLEKSPGIGLGKIIAKLRENDVNLDPGLTEQIHLINQIRVYSVHKKKENFIPSKSQAYAMVLYTIDTCDKILNNQD